MRTNTPNRSIPTFSRVNNKLFEPQKERQTLKQEIAKWSGRQLQLPVEPVFLRYALDTVPLAMEDSKYKIRIYTDSSGCTSCKLQLPK